MVHQFIAGTYRQTNLNNEPEDYLRKREALRQAEIELMKQSERVAALRRELPAGAIVADYEFVEASLDVAVGAGAPKPVRLSQLFTGTDRPLVIYHLMFGKKQVAPCPMCTLWTDGYNGVALHLGQNIDFAIVAAAEPTALQDYARSRRWDNLRLLSASANTFKLDLGSEDDDGAQDSDISVFTKGFDGSVRHFYSAHPRMSPDIKERGIDFLSPVWNLLDLTPQGRGKWYPSIDYGATKDTAIA